MPSVDSLEGFLHSLQSFPSRIGLGTSFSGLPKKSTLKGFRSHNDVGVKAGGDP
jgi:hypothetical protein